MTNRLTAEELKWCGIDFDDTICRNSGFPDFIPTKVIDGFREALDKMESLGLKPVIFTARTWAEYNIIEDWLKDNDLKVKKIICGKPLVKYMIDDRNIEFDGDWFKALAKLK